MKRTAAALAIAALLAVILVVVMARIGQAGLWNLWLDSGPLVKLSVLPLLMLLLLVLILGSISRADRQGGGVGSALKVLAWICLGLGALGSIPSLLTVWSMVQRFHPTRMMVYAPGLGEALLPVTLGLIVAALALVLRRTPALSVGGETH